jgi:hypothetical protein
MEELQENILAISKNCDCKFRVNIKCIIEILPSCVEHTFGR